jgi:large subunit ribosomal protein L24
MALKIRKGDRVEVITGKDKGTVGQVLRVLPGEERVIVERVNFVKRHQRRSGYDKPGGIIEIEAPIHISNVMVIDKKTSKRTRIGFKIQDGAKERVAKKSNETL